MITCHVIVGTRIATQLPPTQIGQGFENLKMTKERMAARGIAGFSWPLNVSCKNHEGDSPGVFIQQWDGKQW